MVRSRLQRSVVRRFAMVAFLLLPATGSADPRWWWDDRPVGSVGAVTDVDVAVANTGLGPLLIFVAWVEPPTLIEGAMRLTASFDGGCSFCPPVHLESLFGPDDDIVLAVAPLDVGPGSLSLAVLHSARGRLQVLHESGSLPIDGTADCSSLQALSLAIQRTELSAGGASEPAVAGLRDGRVTQFHAAWRQVAPTDEESIHYSRDLVGDGTGWEPARALPSSAGIFQRQVSPAVSLDHAVGTGGPVLAVNVAWAVEDSNGVLYLRSVDDGTTFSATGDPPEGLPAIVSQGGLGLSGPVALDSGHEAPLPWQGLSFYQEAGPGAFVRFDAQYQRDPTLADPSWGSDVTLSSAGVFRDDGLANAVLAERGPRDPHPTWTFWTGSVPAGGREIIGRSGRLTADDPVPIDVDLPAFEPVRPDDALVSLSAPLTNCVSEPVTAPCESLRAAGAARRPAAADGLGDVFLAWLDDRSGSPEVWFKRTDRQVEVPQPILASSCPAPGEARITATFDRLPDCGSATPVPEHVDRYLVYYGLVSAGPYLNTDLDGSDPGVPDTIVLVDDGSLSDPVSVDIDGLAPNTEYHVVVVPEDQAGNLWPPMFDPEAATMFPFGNEASVTTPDCAGPGPCLFRATSASLDPAGLFTDPRAANDVAFTAPNDVPYGPCPFASGELDPEAVLDRGAPPLIYYQVEGDGRELHLTAVPAQGTVRLDWF